MLRPALRRDIKVVFQNIGGEACYVVEDVSNRRYYQVGLSEYRFLQHLDGRTSIAEALALHAAAHPRDAFSEGQSATLLRWLIDCQLLENSDPDQAARRFRHSETKKAKRSSFGLKQLMFFRVPIGSPNGFLSSVLPFFRPFLGWGFFFLWSLLMVWAGITLVGNWEAFANARSLLVASGNWMTFALVFVALKAVHEIWHGLLTRRFGGAVPEWGVQMLLFITPLTYVDASSSWHFPSKWKRIYVAAGGMYIEIFLAALAVLIWSRSDPGWINTFSYHTVVAASFVTLLFNANPLLRFDGYYILSDLIDIPNLGRKGQEFLLWFCKRFIIGIKSLPCPDSVRDRPLAIPLYGVLAALWKVVIWTGILIMMALLFKGAGLALVLISLVGLVVSSVVKFLRFLTTGSGGPRPSMARAVPRLALLVAGLVAVMYFVKVDAGSRAAAVVQFADKQIVRVECPGLVATLTVRDGQPVEQGQMIAQLENRSEETFLDQLRIDLQLSKLRSRQFFQRGEIPSHQAEEETMAALTARLQETEKYLATLVLRAPITGIVRGRGLDDLAGRHLNTGEDICTILPKTGRELLISVRQKDGGAMTSALGSSVEFIGKGGKEVVPATLLRIESRATLALPHGALASANGGPLAVRAATGASDRRIHELQLAKSQAGGDGELGHFSGLSGGANRFELVDARFAAVAELDPTLATGLREGQWGYIRLMTGTRKRLGEWLYLEIGEYLKEKLDAVKSGAS